MSDSNYHKRKSFFSKKKKKNYTLVWDWPEKFFAFLLPHFICVRDKDQSINELLISLPKELRIFSLRLNMPLLSDENSGSVC
jgi:hypothetical protein